MRIGFAILLFISWLFLLHHALHKSVVNPAPQTISGTIISIPKVNPHVTSFDFDSNIGKLKLSWYKTNQSLHYGERWRLKVKLKPARGYHNPGAFNFERWLQSRHIVAVGYVVNKASNKLLDTAHSIRAQILRRVMDKISNNTYHDIIIAITLGFSSVLTPEHKNIFQKTGTSHLMAISGLHVGMIATVVFVLISRLCCCLPMILRYYPKQKIAAVFAIVASLAYSALAGFSVSTQRALIMLVFSMTTYYFLSKRSLAASLLLAFIIILLLDPLSIFAAGFWLSFSAVFFLLYTMTGRIGEASLFWKWGRAQLVSSVALVPLSVWLFHGISLTGIFANLIAIPVMSFIVLPLSLLSVLTINSFVITIVTVVLKYLLSFLNMLTIGQVYFAIHTPFQLFCSIIAVLVLFFPKGLRVKPLVLIFLLPIFFPRENKLANGQFELTVLDVGQGLACVIRTQKHVLLFDAGPKYEHFDAGQHILNPYFKFENIKKIDTIVISHGDNDHIGGLASILTQFSPSQIYSSVPLKMHHSAQLCDQNIQWSWNGVRFHFLNDAKHPFRKDNNNSCVLKVTGAAGSVLLTGDIEKQAEQYLVSKDIKSTVVVVPHHGSKTSSTTTFVEKINPKYAVFSYGFLNRFHHPNNKVVQRYRDVGAKILTTVSQGAVRLRF